MALALIMLIAIVPQLFMKKPAPRPVPPTVTVPPAQMEQQPAQQDTGAAGVQAPPSLRAFPGSSDTTLPPEQTVVVRSELYRLAISTLRWPDRLEPSSCTIRRWCRATRPRPASATPWSWCVPATPCSAPAIAGWQRYGATRSRVIHRQRGFGDGAPDTPASLTLTGNAAGRDVSLTYHFTPDDYRITVDGSVSGIGTAGGTLLIGLGSGFRQTEAVPTDNLRESGIVTKSDKTKLTRFGQLKPLSTNTFDGPFEWVAVKSKYFVVGLFAYDSLSANNITGRIGGVVATVPDTFKSPVRAQTAASLTVPAAGTFHWALFLGPMEYNRLKAAGRDFDDVNPYGWAWLRPVIRPLAVMLRAFFVWMHVTLGLGYGLVIVLFGILMRVVLWPLNSKAYRSMGAMQAIQPQITALQAKYKDDPAKLQQETLMIYKENKVNPLSGCWPMLVPYPLLVAVYFVLAQHDRGARRAVPLAHRPVARRPALYRARGHGGLDVPAVEDRADGDAAQSAGEDDDVHDAGDDAGALLALRVRAQSLLRGAEHRLVAAAVADHEGAKEDHGCESDAREGSTHGDRDKEESMSDGR